MTFDVNVTAKAEIAVILTYAPVVPSSVATQTGLLKNVRPEDANVHVATPVASVKRLYGLVVPVPPTTCGKGA